MRAESRLNVQKDERIPPRERILAVAADLFYRHGIRAVGVEAIAEAAGTNKMTLYRHFASKDDLVAEYLRHVRRARPMAAGTGWSGASRRPARAASRLARGDGRARRQCRRARLPARQCRGRVAGKRSSRPAGHRGVQGRAARPARSRCARAAGLGEPDMLADELLSCWRARASRAERRLEWPRRAPRAHGRGDDRGSCARTDSTAGSVTPPPSCPWAAPRRCSRPSAAG